MEKEKEVLSEEEIMEKLDNFLRKQGLDTQSCYFLTKKLNEDYWIEIAEDNEDVDDLDEGDEIDDLVDEVETDDSLAPEDEEDIEVGLGDLKDELIEEEPEELPVEKSKPTKKPFSIKRPVIKQRAVQDVPE